MTTDRELYDILLY